MLFQATGMCAQAQSEISFFILSGQNNANKLAGAYLTPLSKGMCHALAGGWFMGGEKLKPGHFELLIVGIASWVPQKDKTFDVTSIGLSSNVNVAHGDPFKTPTALGPNTKGAHLEVSTKNPNNGKDLFLTDFNTPEGLGIPFIPLPIPQLHIGLVKDTELMVRFLPKVRVNYDEENYTSYLWGLGLKHHLAQWIPSLEKHKLDIVIGIAYAQQNAHASLTPSIPYHLHNGNITQLTEAQKDPSRYGNQTVRMKDQIYVLRLLLSKAFGTWFIHTGLSVSAGATNIHTPGLYPQRDIRSIDKKPYYEYFFNDVVDPIGITVNHVQVGLTSGLQYNMGKFSLNAEGTLANYMILSMGIGFAL